MEQLNTVSVSNPHANVLVVPARPNPVRPSALDELFRALAILGVLEIIALAYNLITHPDTPGIIGQPYLARIILGLVVGPGLLLIGALLLWRLPSNVVPRFLILITTLIIAGQSDLNLGSPFLSSLVRVLFVIVAAGIVAPSLGYLMMHFPTGEVYPVRLAPWLMLLALVKFMGVVLEVMASPREIKIFALAVNPLFVPPLAPYQPLIAATIGITGILLPITLGAGMISLLLRYRAAPFVERQQLKWVVGGLGALMVVMLVGGVFIFGGRPSPAQLSIVVSLASIALLIFIASIIVAITRYHLYEIDLILNRALVYGVLSIVIGGLYVLVVGAASVFLESSNNVIVSLVATGVVAILFQPLRERLQRGVNQLMYGKRDEPYTVLARLGQRLEATLAPNEVLPTIVETIATTLKLPYVAIELRDEGKIVAVYGDTSSVPRPPSPVPFPLIYQHETIGKLIVALREGEESLSNADQNLLGTIAEQAAMAAHAVRVTAELQHSRERLVTAREEERRRIRRDLHDGLGPALASITLKLDATRNLLPPDAAASAQLLKELKTQTQSAIADIRRLVYDLRPPALDELGLVGALREYASRAMVTSRRSDELDILLDVAEPLPTLSAAAEVAAYRISTEALTNVQRHAHARHCHVSLVVNGDLQVEIQDDGAGLPETFHAGVGLTSMRERAAEVGGTCVIENVREGGTRVVARLPLARDEG